MLLTEHKKNNLDDKLLTSHSSLTLIRLLVMKLPLTENTLKVKSLLPTKTLSGLIKDVMKSIEKNKPSKTKDVMLLSLSLKLLKNTMKPLKLLDSLERTSSE